jgi:hypothetical protein
MLMLRFLVKSNLWVGLAVLALSASSYPFGLNSNDYFYLSFLASGTVAAYSYMRLVGMGSGSIFGEGYWRLELFWTGLFLGLATFSIWPIIDWQLALVLLPAFLVVVFYPLSFPHPLRAFTSLRLVPGLKLFLIALAWVYLCYWVPLSMKGLAFTPSAWFGLLWRFLFIVGITIPFDVRDFDRDELKLKTLPQLIGKKAALHLAMFILTLVQLAVIYHYFQWSLMPSVALAWLVGLDIGIWLIWYAQRHSSWLYVSFWIEAIPGFIWIFMLIGEQALGNFYF